MPNVEVAQMPRPAEFAIRVEFSVVFMHHINMRWLLGFLLALLGTTASAQPQPHTKATLHLSHVAATPGSTITAALHLKMDEGWHTYWASPGGPGMPTKIEWQLPPGITAGEIQWPVPEKYKLDEFYNYVFHDETALIIPLTIDAAAKPGPVAIKGKARWLECQTSCIPGSQNVEANLQIGSAQLSPDAARIEQWQSQLPKPARENQITAQWDGPATGDERAIIFTVNKTSGAWDFFNYPIADFELNSKTDPLPSAGGMVLFRKTATKTGVNWPTEIKGLVLIPGDPASASIATITLPASPATAAAPAASATPSLTLPVVLGLAFLGGLILNIMPCVLPVISLKILGFVRQANDDPRRIRMLGLTYALGVIVSFLALAAFIIAIKQGGRSASWGMQFQNKEFLVALTVLVTLLTLSLFGIFEITLGGKALDAASGLAARDGPSGAFFNGVLATILATPCTAPMLGTALGFAFASPSPIILLTFLTIGLGLAAPYVLLCWFPSWLKRLPKPGAWMEKFKIAMGFPMLATAVWLFLLAGAHFGEDTVFLGLLLVMIAFAAWIFGEFIQRGSRRRGLAGGFIVTLVLGGLALFVSTAYAEKVIAWQPWTPAAVQAARSKGHPVLVDFTASWCLTCKINKGTSINIESVQEKLKQLKVATFIADNTAESPEIVAELQKYKRAGVPLVLVFPADPNAEPIVLPEVLTPTLVMDALDKAAAAKTVATE